MAPYLGEKNSGLIIFFKEVRRRRRRREERERERRENKGKQESGLSVSAHVQGQRGEVRKQRTQRCVCLVSCLSCRRLRV
jgi:hypothetical protein